MKRLDHAAVVAALWRGEVVAVPTDTVYGVAARWGDVAATARIFDVKGRPRDVALPVLIASAQSVSDLDVQWSDRARVLAENFWPGALTIVVATSAQTAGSVGATHTLGLRVPRRDDLVAIIAECGPLAVTSANEHGALPCTSAEDVLAVRWASPVAGVLDGGVCDGAVSSVVELSARGWRLHRHGAVAGSDIERLIGPESGGDDQ